MPVWTIINTHFRSGPRSVDRRGESPLFTGADAGGGIESLRVANEAAGMGWSVDRAAYWVTASGNGIREPRTSRSQRTSRWTDYVLRRHYQANDRTVQVFYSSEPHVDRMPVAAPGVGPL